MTSEISGSSQPPAESAGVFPPKGTLLGDIVEKLLGLISALLSPGLLESSIGTSKRLGHYTVLAGAALTVIYGLIAAVKMEAFALVITAVVLVGAIAVAQFAASKFLNAATRIIANTPSRVSSPAFFECAGLTFIIVAIGILLGGLGGAVSLRNIAPLLVALVFAALIVSFATVMLHPDVVNVSVGEGSAGEEAVGILMTITKAKLKIVPLVFFLVAALGSVIVFAGFFGERAAASFTHILPVNLYGVPFGFVGSALIVVACMVPIIFYFFCLLQFLLLDFIRSVLAVPGKLDELKK